MIYESEQDIANAPKFSPSDLLQFEQKAPKNFQPPLLQPSIKPESDPNFPRKANPYLVSLQKLRKLHLISQGSFGKVYQYYNPNKNEFYAVKQMIFNPKNMHSISEIKTEMNLLYEVQSPYLVKMYDHFVKDNTIYLVMELVDGKNLYQAFLKPKISLQTKILAQMMLDICLGLQYLHTKKIVHRDLKLQNVILSSRGQIKIIDLGESNYFGQGVMRKTVRGTKTYFSPEMANRDLQDDRIDVWCLGVILYQLACLQSPFKGANQEELFENIRRFRYGKDKIKDPMLSNLLSKIFTWHEQRIKIQGIMQHPWIVSTCTNISENTRDNQPEVPVFQTYFSVEQIKQHKQFLIANIQKYRAKVKDMKERNKKLQQIIEQCRNKKIKICIKD